MSDRPGLEQLDAEARQNLSRWERKPVLRRAYAALYRAIAARLQGLPPGLVVECGSGIGNLKQALPGSLATDLFPRPWLDRVENVYRLGFEGGSVAALVLFDVLHHLERPGTALREIARVLAPGGRLVVFEPALGLLGRLALGLFHHEPLGLSEEIRWEAPPGFDPARALSRPQPAARSSSRAAPSAPSPSPRRWPATASRRSSRAATSRSTLPRACGEPAGGPRPALGAAHRWWRWATRGYLRQGPGSSTSQT